MPPVVVGASRFASALETGQAKLWVLLVGVNHYDDEAFPGLRYATADCQGIGEALAEATHAFPQKEFLIHHDLAPDPPTLSTVQASLERVTCSAQPRDTVLMYFSGHGVVERESQQTILCLRDTNKAHLLSTGLHLQAVLAQLGRCAAHSQLIWLDACHSGNMTLSGSRGRDAHLASLNPTHQLVEVLRERAAKSRGFYALLSCDEGQQSWEFPDLGHGIFSYYLMRGLRGEAAGRQGVIDADGLYSYVYNQTLQYIEQTNQQLRLVNKQKRTKGETLLHPEYSLQTPKRIVEGVGEIVLGLKPSTFELWQQRSALLVGDSGATDIQAALQDVLSREGQFEAYCFPDASQPWTEVRTQIQDFLQTSQSETLISNVPVVQMVPTRLLYVRAQAEVGYDGDGWLKFPDQVKLSRSWLRQELRRARAAQQIIILDCLGGTALEEWVEELKIPSEHGQCVIAAASPSDEPHLFAQILLDVLITAQPQKGLAIASLLAKLQTNLDGLGLPCQIWLSGVQGLIEILPSGQHSETEMQSTSTPEPPAEPPSPVIEQPAAPLPMTADHQQDLESLLLNLVGPIAPTLLAQVMETGGEGSLSTIVQDVLALLPGHQRAVAEAQIASWLASLRDRGQSGMGASPGSPSASGPPPSQAVSPAIAQPAPEPTPCRLGAEGYALAEQILLNQIGPIAPALLQQIPSTAVTLAEFLAALSDHLTSHQLHTLEQQLQQALQSRTPPTASSPQGQWPPTQAAQSVIQPAGGRGSVTFVDRQEAKREIDDGFVQTCEQELARLVGPIAHFIVTSQRSAHAHASREEFVACLSGEIPDATKAAAFRQRIAVGDP
jgi:uncharacterized caspase-like protein